MSTKTPRYNPETIEKAVQKTWQNSDVYKTPQPGSDNKRYILSMFPYPSGDGLHMGHARIYTGTDVLARYYRMIGKSVLHPMGWDAFGLPAENQAIKRKTIPQKIVPNNIKNFRKQFDALGMGFDWDKEIHTTDPNYYAITQKLFIEFFKHGLLYKKQTPVYYCPSCKTGVAQEEVLGDGTHERCGNAVEQRNLNQWLFRITEYADSLLEGLDGLHWPKGILEMQKNWIGKKEGAEIEYPIEGTDESISCFTTRPDTNYGATFIVLAPEHPLVDKLLSGEVEVPDSASKEDIQVYVKKAQAKTERERKTEEKTKTGVFTGLYATNRLNGEKLPVWISDFVLAGFGTGAVVGVPAHDKRDYDFAASFDLPVKRVVKSLKSSGENDGKISHVDDVFEDYGVVINSGEYSGMDSQKVSEKIINTIESNGWGKRSTTYHLRDWIFSRQRYWGEPIPMIYCQKCADSGINYWNSEASEKSEMNLEKGREGKSFGQMVSEIKDDLHGWFPLNDADLPLKLPEVEKYEPTGSGESPLSKLTDWKTVRCPECGSAAERETDTMPNWAGSNWYFLAFPFAESIASGTQDVDIDFESVEKWMPVDWYIGGTEHAVLHLLYARFWMHVLNDLGSTKVREPFQGLHNVGLVLAEDGTKMSKSKGNVINPTDVVDEYGGDALRVYIMFMAPFTQEIAWSTQSVQGAYRFIRRIWHIYNASDKITKNAQNESNEVVVELQRVFARIHKDITNVKFNTPIAAIMEFLNFWEKNGVVLSKNSAEALLKCISIYAPFVSEYIWQDVLKNEGSIHNERLSEVNEELLHNQDMNLPVQVDGKVRDTIFVSSGVSQDDVVARALESDKIQKWVGNKEYKVVYVEAKILNFVLLS